MPLKGLLCYIKNQQPVLGLQSLQAEVLGSRLSLGRM